jgi:cation:H+ antiporter
MTYAYLVLGLVLLLAGGEMLVRYASRLAVSLGVSPLVVGLTIVAFGTSAPELTTSVYAQWIGEGGLAIGNVVGSNIFNVLGILGLSALATPLAVDTKLLEIEVPIVLGLSLLVGGFAYSGTIARWEAALLFAPSLVYIAWLVYDNRRDSEESVSPEGLDDVVADTPQHWAITGGLSLLGLLLVVAGGRLLVSGATELARALRIDESIIALTIVAVGTSLPELVTSVLASLRGQREIAVGNVVGSNLLNLAVVLGGAGLIGSQGMQVDAVLLQFDLPVMTATAIVCLPIMFTGGRIDRWEGGIFVLYYLGYTTYLVLEATEHAVTPTFGRAMLWVVVPLTLLTIGVIAFRERTS